MVKPFTLPKDGEQMDAAYKAGIITDESIVEEYEGYLREVVSIKERVKRDLASYV